MAAAVSQILINNYVYGPSDELVGIEEGVGIPCADAIFSPIGANNPKADDGVEAKITYRNDPVTVFYTNETSSQLVAQANGNLSAS